MKKFLKLKKKKKKKVYVGLFEIDELGGGKEHFQIKKERRENLPKSIIQYIHSAHDHRITTYVSFSVCCAQKPITTTKAQNYIH